MTTAAPPSRRRTPEEGLRRIRALVAVAVGAAALLGIVGSILAVRAYDSAKGDEVARLENSAAVAAGDYSQFLLGRRYVLQALATSDAIVAGDAAGIQRRLDRIDTEELSLGEGVTWFDADGAARASVGARLATGARAQGDLGRLLSAAAAGGIPQVSGSIDESVYGEPVIAIAVPTRNADGRVNGALVGAVSIAFLNRRAVERREFRGGNVFILDRTGHLFVAPGLDASRPLGDDPVIRRIRTSPTRPVAEAVAGSLTGVRNPLGEGGRVLGFATEARTSGWTFIIDDAESSAFADARTTLAIELGVLGLLVALGIAGALLLGRRLTHEYADARTAEDRVRRLQEVTAGLSAASTPADVAGVVLERGRDATGAAAGSVAVIDEDGTTVTTLMLLGYNDAIGRAFPSYPITADLPTPDSIRHGPLWLRDVAEVRAAYPHLRDFHESMSHEAVVALPLVVEGEPIGGIALSYAEPQAFDDEERAFLTSIADLAAQALDRARLYELEQRKTDRQQLLAEAGTLLDAPLGARAALTALANLSVPRLADWCSVSIPADDGIEVVAVAHADPAKVAMAKELNRRFPARPDDPTGVGAVLRTGRPEFIPALTPELIEELVPPDDRRRAVAELGIVAGMTVPLAARGRILGALTLVSAESGRRFTTDDLAFAEDLGARAGLAIDNAMLLDRSREIARTLQDSLLPASLPDVEGLDVAARYVAGGEGVEVGGDFYDLFPVDGGRGWAAVLGDVCGKGTEAAALTALARHTLRAESQEVSPAEVLGRLNRAILREGTDSRFLTATYAWLRRVNGSMDVRLARGGHPPALLVRADGSVETLCPAGPLLGIMDDIRFAESGFALGPGDTLVLFSDGVIEARSPDGELFGMDRLTAIAAQAAHGGAEEIAEALESAIARFGAAEASDDRALLVIRVTGERR
ncbi:MAG TPA: SpoIIE family protein phosphatase [Miltoncostaeaceae bacterium]|nr:SpoIIE family protein phosphatase [Miltoncostaeaceae bacterium]